jgi:hypothetical protein
MWIYVTVDRYSDTENLMKALLKDNRGMTLVVLMMLIAILASMAGATLLFSRVDLMISSNLKRGTQALYAADAGVGEAINQISANRAASVQAFGPRDIGAGFAYRSGRRTDSGPQPLEFIGVRTMPGYSLGSGTGYNPSGYVFLTYEIHVTGTGPVTAAREIEAMGGFGPVRN